MPTFGAAMGILFFSTAYYYHGRAQAMGLLLRAPGTSLDAGIWAGILQCGAAFLLLLLPALLIVRLGLKVPFADMGWRLGDWKWGLKISLAALPLVCGAIWLTTDHHSQLCAVYPLSDLARNSLAGFLVWQACYLVYYIAWEGLFRGLIQLGLQERLGIVQAILFQTALSTLLHAGGPELETFAALAAGPVLGYVALRTGSIGYVILIHFAAGIATDLACIAGLS